MKKRHSEEPRKKTGGQEEVCFGIPQTSLEVARDGRSVSNLKLLIVLKVGFEGSEHWLIMDSDYRHTSPAHLKQKEKKKKAGRAPEKAARGVPPPSPALREP